MEEIGLMRPDLKTDLISLGERLEVLEERVSENQQSNETRFEAMDEHMEKTRHAEADEGKIAAAVSVKVSERSDKLSKKLDAQFKKLQEVENKVDSALISAPETGLIKKDLREEFAPLLGLDKKMEQNHQATSAKLASLSRKIASQRTALEAKVASLKKKRTVTRKATVTVKKSTVRKPVKASKKPASKKPVKALKSSKSEVTVTTKVPRGVDVSTEVVTGKKR